MPKRTTSEKNRVSPAIRAHKTIDITELDKESAFVTNSQKPAKRQKKTLKKFKAQSAVDNYLRTTKTLDFKNKQPGKEAQKKK